VLYGDLMTTDAPLEKIADDLAGGRGGTRRVEEPKKQARLVFASFLMLFVELALIRWITANNVFVTETTNLILLASFLGIGIGFLNARSGRDYLRWAPVALLALVAFVLMFPVVMHSTSGPTPFRGIGQMPALPRPLSFSAVFVLTVAVMAGFGQAVARVFVGFRPLSAYRLDILGSIAGITLFSVLSFLDQPPATWGVIAGAGLVGLLLPRVRWWQVAAVAGAVTLLAIESFTSGQSWSPYNKLAFHERHGDPGMVRVVANNILFQTIRPVSRLQDFYFFPYRHVTPQNLGQVLIIGAGTGNDVAVALSKGAGHVDAVEIDPQLVAAGRQRHLNHPYQDPRVTVHVTDGRQYLQDTSKRYNLILLALPDSLTALAGQSGIRLESYLLTEQSIAAARAHLAPGGTFAMYNWYAPFVFNRYATTIEDVFHRTPCAELSGGSRAARRPAVLTVAPGGPVPHCASFWHGTRIAPATDNWPFPYLPHPAIPAFYLAMLAAILLGSVLLVRAGGGSFTRMTSYVDLAFMGAAFMLLETKSIVGFALLFGTTWFVNALVFAGVLVAVYLAVETARWVRLPPPIVLYGALLAALAVAWLVPQASLLGLPVIPRFLAASALAFAPVFLANLVFAQRFSGVEGSGTAFAANLLGAMVGGTIEYVSLITGYRFLLIVVAVLYALAFATGLRQKVAGNPGQAKSMTGVRATRTALSSTPRR
jgi:Spermine/spermidine synthase domain